MDKNYTVIHYVDTGTGYSEGGTGNDGKGITLVQEFDKLWINRHDAPNYFSVDE